MANTGDVEQYDLVILGAGAAGMIGAIAAQEAARAAGGKALRVAVFEKNKEAGIKVLVCGGGRCNFTNAGSVGFLIEQFGRNGRFLTPALEHLDNEGLRAFFAGMGVPSHEEHDGKVYPNSNEARSVVEALVRRMRELGVEIFAGEAVTELKAQRHGGTEAQSKDTPAPEPLCASVPSCLCAFSITTPKRTLRARAVLMATGGMSYQRMGTTGDGYRFAEALGHSLVTPRPAIVGLLTQEEWPKALQGTAVDNVEVKIEVSGPLPRLATGKPTPSINDMLFTHFGLSGPAVLNVSEIVAELLEKMPTVTLQVDLVRHLTHEQLGELLRNWQQNCGKKLVRKMLVQGGRDVTISATSPDLSWSSPGIKGPRVRSERFVSVPTRLAEQVLVLAGVPADLPCAHLTSAHIHQMIQILKNARFTITATRGFKEAMVTAGGIALSEVDPHTLESKIVPNLFITGEVLDLTGPSGGYNLQLAFSTGHLAGTTAAQRLCS